MSENKDQAPGGAAVNPEERALSGHPDHAPKQPDHTREEDEELLRQGHADPSSSEDAASQRPHGEEREQPGAPLAGYG
jgi:hypothetical protein